MGRLLSIATKAEPRAAMVTCETSPINSEGGVQGDCRGKPGKRQVTVLSSEQWADACRELSAVVDWTLRRANLLVEGVALRESAGRRLRVGGVLLEITGETVPCGRMDAQHDGLTAALVPEWRGGVTCRVLEGGTVAVGDDVEIEVEAPD